MNWARKTFYPEKSYFELNDIQGYSTFDDDHFFCVSPCTGTYHSNTHLASYHLFE